MEYRNDLNALHHCIFPVSSYAAENRLDFSIIKLTNLVEIGDAKRRYCYTKLSLKVNVL